MAFALSENLSVDETLSLHDRLPFSRIPVFAEDLDHVSGFVLKSEILRAGKEKGAALLSELSREMTVVPGDLPVHKLFEQLMNENTHLALVVDGYGGTEGVVTMEDFIETLLGLEIVDEVDTVEDMQAMAREQWRRRARSMGLIDGTP